MPENETDPATAVASRAVDGTPQRRRIAFVAFFGSAGGDFFSDVLLGLLAADARARGHHVESLRVVYSGTDGAADAALDERVAAILHERDVELVVADRLVREGPLARWRAGGASRRVALVPTGEGLEGSPVVDVAIFASPYSSRGSPRTELESDRRHAFLEWLDVLEEPARWRDVPGAHPFVDGTPSAPRSPLAAARDRGRLPYHPELAQEVLAAAGTEAVRRYTVYANQGCPYANDAATTRPYRSLALADDPDVLRLGCTFCHMGGDYEKRDDDEVVRSVLDQVRYLAANVPTPPLESVLLSDQAPLRYLALLLERAAEAELPPLTWLFQTRADWIVRDEAKLVRAIDVARATGQRLSLYLVGFESFSDEELERYNKGVTAAQLLEAFERMDAIAKASSGVFSYDATRGHSLVLFNPWTEPRHLAESARAIRRHGLGRLFSDPALNRLRLYPNLPIAKLAIHDGLTQGSWDPGGLEGSARRKGYSVDLPWRFADRRSALAYELSMALRDAVGRESRVPQLIAVSRHAERASPDVDVGAELERTGADLRRLTGLLWSLKRRPRSTHVRAASVRLAGACNNGCEACPNADEREDDRPEAELARIDAARATKLPVILAGREPTMHPRFPTLVAHARGSDRRAVGVVSNGRRFAYPAFARAAARAGLTAASIKLFGATAEVADAVTRDDGSHAQALDGIGALVALRLAVEVRAVVSRASIPTLHKLAPLVARLGVRTIRVDLQLDAIGLDGLAAAADAIEQLDVAARALGLSVFSCSPTRGMTDAESLPT